MIPSNIKNEPAIGELFYISPMHIFGQPHRGGIPIIFPQFANYGPLPKHGFARNSVFTPVSFCSGDNVTIITEELHVTAGDWPEWPHAAHLLWRINIQPGLCDFKISIRNTGESTFNWTGGLHPYFRVENLLHISIHGLKGAQYKDKFATDSITMKTDSLRFNDHEFERLYLSNSDLKLYDETDGRELLISCQGFTEWMIWNPGTLLARSINDLPNDDWQKFICIEPVQVSHANELKPGQQFEGSLTVVVKS